VSSSAVRDTAPPVIPGYRFIRDLGAGGSAQVYLYEQDLPRREVAVKVLNESALPEAARRRFTAEANVTARLQHRHIVQVFDAKVTDDGQPYLVMPYYPQPNLSVRARRSHFTVAEVLRVGIQIGSAVETSHRAGVLHRDIKPQNILTDSYGEPVLTDFGIATTKGDGPEGISVPWSPPEILFGSGPGDLRSDVYSLGATLWHLLAGRSPFEYPGDSNATPVLMERIKRDPLPRTQRSDVPESLERLLWQTLAKDPAARPQTAMELIHGLQSVEQELRLPLTQPVLSAGQLPPDGLGSGALSRQNVLGDETTQRRALGGQPGQPLWGGGFDATMTRDPGAGSARPAPAAGYESARGATGPRPGPPHETSPGYLDGRGYPADPDYADVPGYSGAPGHAGRRAKASSRRVLALAGGVALLAVVVVVAALRLSTGHGGPSAGSAANVQSTGPAGAAAPSAAGTAGASAVASQTRGAPTAAAPSAAGTAGATVVTHQSTGVPTAGTGKAPTASTGNQPPQSSSAVQAVARPDPPSGISAKATGQSQTIQFTFTPGPANAEQVSSIEFGLSAAGESGTITGPFTAGTSYTETISPGNEGTGVVGSPLDDGYAATVYVAECNNAGLCSSFSGPSAPVIPYAQIDTPTVTATATGTTIAYSWSALSDGLSETLQVCIAGVCTNSAIPATPGGRYGGSSSVTYATGQTETITGHLTDTAGQSSATVSASATTAAAS
jgi:serine/threonine protein kinase